VLKQEEHFNNPLIEIKKKLIQVAFDDRYTKNDLKNKPCPYMALSSDSS